MLCDFCLYFVVIKFFIMSLSLPLALLARLRKRGIVKAAPETEEEVIAENYDDEDEVNDISDQQNQVHENVNEPVLGCPNKWNIYHDCCVYCLETWGNGRLQPSPKMEKKRLRMLKNYPLPEGWEEIYDPGTGRFYYWSIISGEVSWLPPDHPRSQLCMPAHSLRTMLRNGLPLPAQYIPMPMEEDREPSESDEEEEEEEEDDDEEEDEEEEEEEAEEEEENEEVESRDTDKEKHSSRDEQHINSSRDEQHINSRGREKVRGNDLDPMDPAAYSEAPRGTWSSGLDRKGEAKTGADTTASGPLYQMRPYPSPGAVLRLNATLKQGYSDESESEEDD